MDHLLTIITFVPIAGLLVIMLCPKEQHGLIRWIAVAATAPQILIAIVLCQHFDTATTAVQFAENYPGCRPTTSTTTSASTASACRWCC